MPIAFHDAYLTFYQVPFIFRDVERLCEGKVFAKEHNTVNRTWPCFFPPDLYFLSNIKKEKKAANSNCMDLKDPLTIALCGRIPQANYGRLELSITGCIIELLEWIP